jgi:hypothetical protein
MSAIFGVDSRTCCTSTHRRWMLGSECMAARSRVVGSDAHRHGHERDVEGDDRRRHQRPGDPLAIPLQHGHRSQCARRSRTQRRTGALGKASEADGGEHVT